MTDRPPSFHDVRDLPSQGDVVVIDGLDHTVQSVKTHHFRSDTNLVWEYVVHAATPSTDPEFP